MSDISMPLGTGEKFKLADISEKKLCRRLACRVTESQLPKKKLDSQIAASSAR